MTRSGTSARLGDRGGSAPERPTASETEATGDVAAVSSPRGASSPFPLACFVCGKPLKTVKGGAGTQPMGGLLFIARGNYGSRIFDPFSTTERLDISICDGCLEARPDRVAAVREVRPRPTFTARRFASFDEFRDEGPVDDD